MVTPLDSYSQLEPIDTSELNVGVEWDWICYWVAVQESYLMTPEQKKKIKTKNAM